MKKKQKKRFFKKRKRSFEWDSGDLIKTSVGAAASIVILDAGLDLL